METEQSRELLSHKTSNLMIRPSSVGRITKIKVIAPWCICKTRGLNFSYNNLKYNQKLCGVKSFLAIELTLFSRIMQTRYNSKELSEWNFILARVVKFCSFKEL